MVNNPIIAKVYISLSITDIKTKNLAKNPPSGGIPANEKNRIKKEKATTLTNYFLGSFKDDLSLQNRYLKHIGK